MTKEELRPIEVRVAKWIGMTVKFLSPMMSGEHWRLYDSKNEFIAQVYRLQSFERPAADKEEEWAWSQLAPPFSDNWDAFGTLLLTLQEMGHRPALYPPGFLHWQDEEPGWKVELSLLSTTKGPDASYMCDVQITNADPRIALILAADALREKAEAESTEVSV